MSLSRHHSCKFYKAFKIDFSSATIRQDAACRNIRTIRRSEYFDGTGLQIKNEEIMENKRTATLIKYARIYTL